MAKFLRKFGVPRQVPNRDTTPPSDPSGLAASTANPSVLTLSVPSTDNVAVTGYEVSRSAHGAGVYSILPNSPTLTFPFSDSTVTNGSAYDWRARAFDAAGNFSNFSNVATATIAAGLAIDTTAPLTPGSAPTQVAVSTTNATIALSLVTDSNANSGTQVVSGMSQYLVKVNGTVVGAPVPQPSPTLTFASGVDIGTPSPAGTDGVATGVYTLTCGGNQWTGTLDQLHLLAGQVTGDFDFTARVTSISSTSGNQYSKVGIVARDGTDPAAQYISMVAIPYNGGSVFSDFRTPAGNSAGWSGSIITQALPRFFGISRRQNTFTASHGATAGSLSVINTQVIPMASTINLGIGLCASNASDSVVTQVATGVVDTVAFTAGTVVDFTDSFSGSSSPGVRLYSYAGVDKAGNIGAYSPTLSVTPTATSSGTTTKFNPGHYNLNITRPDYPGAFSTWQTTVNDMDGAYVSSSQRFMGTQLEPLWYHSETAAGGQYYFDTGSPIYNPNNIYDLALNYLATVSAARGVDYKLIIYINGLDSLASLGTVPQAAPYSTSGQASRFLCPDYVITNGWNYKDLYGDNALKLWIPACMTAFINWMVALGNRFDSNPHVEMIIPLYETAANATNISDPTFTIAGWQTQLNRLQAAMSTAWPTTQKVFFGNYGLAVGSTVQSSTDLAANMAAWIPSTSAGANPGFCFGGPDLLYSTGDGAPTYGDSILRGLIGGHNYQGQIGCVYEEQANSFVWTDQTAVLTEAYGYNTLKTSHTVWCDCPAGVGSNTSAYWTAVVAAVQAQGYRIATSSKPTSYT